VFTPNDAAELLALLRTGTDAQTEYFASTMRLRFQTKIVSLEERKAFVYLLARLVKSCHFLSCFFTFAPEIKEFVTFADFVGPQLIKKGKVSELMRQIRLTEVVKAAVEFQGEVRSPGGTIKLRASGGGGAGPPLRRVTVQDMIAKIREQFTISDDDAILIRQVTEQKIADPDIRDTVQAHRDDRPYLDGAYRVQVNGEIKVVYNDLGRFEDLTDGKYTDTGGIFDIMAVTVIQTHLSATA